MLNRSDQIHEAIDRDQRIPLFITKSVTFGSVIMFSISSSVENDGYKLMYIPNWFLTWYEKLWMIYTVGLENTNRGKQQDACLAIYTDELATADCTSKKQCKN